MLAPRHTKLEDRVSHVGGVVNLLYVGSKAHQISRQGKPSGGVVNPLYVGSKAHHHDRHGKLCKGMSFRLHYWTDEQHRR